ncbi:2-polyprenylphenol 6-hydroxylase [Bacillota bacterium LX-D]|nr:2-polyprenylphenol 6-hydroxylase [Bacillota bacterium LX-D]
MVINRYEHLKRYQEIIVVFARHGFGVFIDQLGLFRYLNIKKRIIKIEAENEYAKLSIGERLRVALEELGPTFIKLGQVISTRPDLFSKEIINELEKLQDAVQLLPFSDIRSVIENEFDEKLENIYTEFTEKPLAAASIAQVHLARLRSGKQVVVKVQRPGIERNIDLDLKILKDLAYFIDNHTQYGKLYNFSKMVKEFENTLKNELDFRVEGENAETFKRNFSKDKGILVPSISWIHTTRRVLTMEYIDGIRLSDFDALEKAGIDRKLIAKKLATSIFNQVLRDGFFHGDPHPGNIMVLPDNTIAFLDLGMVGKLSEERKIQFLKILIGVTSKNSKLIVEALMELNAITARVNTNKLEKEFDAIRNNYLSHELNKLKIGELLNEVFKIAFSYKIMLPPEFTMLAKSLITMEGLVEKLDPQLSVLEIAEPIAKKLAFATLSPEYFAKIFFRGITNYSSLIKELPIFILSFIKRIEEEDFTFYFKIQDIEKIIRRIDRISNRISFSIVLLAVSIIIAGIIIGSGMSAHTGVEVYQLNIVLLKIGLAVAGIITIGLVLSVFRSGLF